VQRSTDLVNWEDWRLVDLGEDGCEAIDSTRENSHYYRAVEDKPMVQDQ
jgi:hypothetical protein